MNISAAWQNKLITLPKIKIYPLHEYLVILLFLFYVFYTGLGYTHIIPYYDIVDEAIVLFMALLTAVKFFLRKFKLLIPLHILLLIISVSVLTIFSALINASGTVLAFKYLYSILRPVIILFFLVYYRVNISRVIHCMVVISWILLLYNLPAVLYNMAVYNVQVLIPKNNDLIVGFFPFKNNDSLTILYVVLLTKDFYDALFRKKKQRWFRIPFLYILLISTMNQKFFAIATVTYLIAIVVNSHFKVQNLIIFLGIASIPAMVLVPYTITRSKSIQSSPIVIILNKVFSGEVVEYDYVVGTGPGTLASPFALDTQSKLSVKYGIQAIKNYWSNFYHGPTGTLSSYVSSVMTLTADCGVVITLFYFLLLLVFLIRVFRRISWSYEYLLGFTMGSYCLILGIFMNTWFWGVEVFFLILAMAKVLTDKSIRKVGMNAL